MAYLSVPSPGKWISDLFGENMFRPFFDDFLDQHVSKKWTSEGSSEGVTQIKKGSYIDPLVMRFSPKSEFLIGNFHQNFSFLVKPYFLFFQYRNSVLKKTQIFGPLFEPCSSCVAVDSFFFQKKHDSWKKETLPKGHFKVIFDNFCPSAPMSIFWGGGEAGGTLRRQLGEERPPVPAL